MQVDLNLNPESVEQYIAKAVLDSQLGKAVKEATDRVMDDFKSTYSRALENIVRGTIEKIVREYVINEKYEELKQAVRAKFTDETIESLVSRVFERTIN